MKHPDEISFEELKKWALSEGVNPAWIDIFATYQELLSDYKKAYNQIGRKP